MIKLESVLSVHKILINRYGGAYGVRDSGLLDASINRPYSTFGGQDLYDTPEKKAAAILESIVTNHPFVDGNKRTGYVLMRLVLMEEKKDVTASQQSKYDFVIRIASGELSFEQILEWIEENVIRTE
ncbi:MAG: Fic family protein [Bacteroidota bacterium]